MSPAAMKLVAIMIRSIDISETDSDSKHVDILVAKSTPIRPFEQRIASYSRVARLMKASLPLGTIKDFDFKQLDVVLENARKGSSGRHYSPVEIGSF